MSNASYIYWSISKYHRTFESIQNMRANKIALENCMAEIEANRIDSKSVSVRNVSSVTEKEKMAFIKFCGTIREEKKMEVIFMCQMLKFIIECRRFLYVVQFIPMASYSTLCIAAIAHRFSFIFFYRNAYCLSTRKNGPYIFSE